MFLILYKKIDIYLLPFFGSFIYPLEKVEDLMPKSSCQRCLLFGQFWEVNLVKRPMSNVTSCIIWGCEFLMWKQSKHAIVENNIAIEHVLNKCLICKTYYKLSND